MNGKYPFISTHMHGRRATALMEDGFSNSRLSWHAGQVSTNSKLSRCFRKGCVCVCVFWRWRTHECVHCEATSSTPPEMCAHTDVVTCLWEFTRPHKVFYALMHAGRRVISLHQTHMLTIQTPQRNHKTQTQLHPRDAFARSITPINKHVPEPLWAFPTWHPESPITANKGG